MKPLIFPNDEALRVALTTGLVPEEIAATPVTFVRQPDGTLKVFPAKPLGKAEAKLAAAGVKTGPEEKVKGAREARCWAAALAPRAMTGAEPAGGMVLFVLPESTSTLELGAEMLRLGCDRQDFAFTREAAMLRAVDPPYFTLAAVMDRSRALRAFVPTPPGQERVWTELGYSHPLASSLSAPQGALLLIGGDGEWTTLADGPWTNLYQVLEMRLPGAPVAREAIGAVPRLPVTLRLARATRNEPAQLWVIRENALEAVDGLVRNLSDDVLSRFLFAATGDAKNPIVVLRSRPGRGGAAEIVVSGESYVPLMQIANVFVPRDATVEPPLRREKLRELLAKDERVAWLAPKGGERFELESLPEAAFHPLGDWVDYVVHSRADALVPWVRSTTFSFEAFESVGAEWADERPKRKDDEDAKRAKPRGPRDGRRDDDRDEPPPPPMPVVVEKSVTKTATPAAPVTEFRLAPTGKEEQELATLEREFVELDAAADDARRAPMWLRMAGLNATLNRARDAGLCWTRALWEATGSDAARIAEQWALGEAYLQRKESADATARDLLGRKAPGREDTRALAAQVVLAAVRQESVPVIAGDVHRVQVWLDTHDDNLDVRSLWLARSALARLVGGDRLALARTRDRILAKLHRGLSLERDVPTFLRFLGQSGGKERDGAGSGTARLADVLEELLTRFEKTDRKRSVVEAPVALTKAYVHLIFAYGFARLGQAERARALREGAFAVLDAKDPIHRLLSRSYGARIDQALEGLPVETPLPADLQQELNGLEKFLRYKVDRLRQASTILESQERLDPTQAFQRGDRDPRGEEFAGMRGMTDASRLSEEIDRLLRHAMAADTKPEDSARLFDGLMDFFPMLPEAQALPKLMALLRDLDDIEAPRRALLLEEALMLAGYFGRGDLVREIVGTLKDLFGRLSEEHAAEIGGMLGRCLRSLRRVGLKAEAADLLETISKAVASQGAQSLMARLNLAAGLAYLGHIDRAKPVFEEAHEALKTNALQGQERLALVRSLAGALSQAPQDYAVAGIMRLTDQLKTVTDSYNQNSHFCLSVLHFMESLVLGVASEDLALGEFGRRWLDEDEYLVRRRVFRELGGSE